MRRGSGSSNTYASWGMRARSDVGNRSGGGLDTQISQAQEENGRQNRGPKSAMLLNISGYD